MYKYQILKTMYNNHRISGSFVSGGANMLYKIISIVITEKFKLRNNYNYKILLW